MAETNLFGSLPSCLDIFTLRYRWFGVVWSENSRGLTIKGFWFGDSREDVKQQAVRAGLEPWMDCQKEETVSTIYSHIRREQDAADWQRCSCLPPRSGFTHPWNEVPKGWYVIRSQPRYPAYVAAVKRSRFRVRILHSRLCEHASDASEFVNAVSREQGVEFRFVDVTSNVRPVISDSRRAKGD